MKYFITESHFNEYVRLLSEQEDENYDYLDEYYDDEDFMEVFFEHFRPWIKSKHGEDVGKYPLSYLLKKYFIEFCKDYGLDYDDEDEYWSYSQLSRVGKEIVIRKQHKLPTLLPSYKFTEKYAKQIDYLLKSLKLPNWLTMSFTEESVYNVTVNLIIDYDLYLKSGGDESATSYFDEFKVYLNNFMGIEEGNPSHGGLKLTENIELNNTDKFTNPKEVKLLKSKIKSLPHGDRIHSIKLDVNHFRTLINLNFSRGWRYDYSIRDNVRKEILNMLNKEGYNKDKVRVSI